MKILPTITKPSFIPIEVTFVFETQDEIDAMAALFNYHPVTYRFDVASGNMEGAIIIREGLKARGADSNRLFPEMQKIK